jgi:hypothetical protein
MQVLPLGDRESVAGLPVQEVVHPDYCARYRRLPECVSQRVDEVQP